MNTFETVSKIISEQLGLSADFAFSKETTWEELGADSLDLVEIVMSIEDEFGVEIPDEKLFGMENMGDLVSFIESIK